MEQAILNQGYFPVKVTVSQNNNKVNVFLDGDHGISVDECGKVNKKLQEYLDEDPEVPENYVLDVSSAGLDEPLWNLRQYKKNIQRHLKIRNAQRQDTVGKLVYVDEQELVIETKDREMVHFDWQNVEEAKVDIANI